MFFRKIVNDKVLLMVGVHVDDFVVSGESDFCDEFFGELKERFPVKHQAELKMYTGCAFERSAKRNPTNIPDGLRGKHDCAI